MKGYVGRTIFYIIAIFIFFAIVRYTTRGIDLFSDSEIEIILSELKKDENVKYCFGEIREVRKVLPGSLKGVYIDNVKGSYNLLIKGELDTGAVTVKFHYERDSVVIDTILLK
jgi:hypothetical protein